MCPDDRFLPQGKQIVQKICQVRPMPNYRVRAVTACHALRLRAGLQGFRSEIE